MNRIVNSKVTRLMIICNAALVFLSLKNAVLPLNLLELISQGPALQSLAYILVFILWSYFILITIRYKQLKWIYIVLTLHSLLQFTFSNLIVFSDASLIKDVFFLSPILFVAQIFAVIALCKIKIPGVSTAFKQFGLVLLSTSFLKLGIPLLAVYVEQNFIFLNYAVQLFPVLLIFRILYALSKMQLEEELAIVQDRNLM